MSDGFGLISIYSKHLNLGFQRGTLLDDPHQLLQGTGKLMRHIPINCEADYRNEAVEQLLQAAFDLAIEDLDHPPKSTGQTISKIKR